MPGIYWFPGNPQNSLICSFVPSMSVILITWASSLWVYLCHCVLSSSHNDADRLSLQLVLIQCIFINYLRPQKTFFLNNGLFWDLGRCDFFFLVKYYSGQSKVRCSWLNLEDLHSLVCIRLVQSQSHQLSKGGQFDRAYRWEISDIIFSEHEVL